LSENLTCAARKILHSKFLSVTLDYRWFDYRRS